MNMHFKLGLYEHQSASAIHAIVELLSHSYREVLGEGDNIDSIKIKAYNPAF